MGTMPISSSAASDECWDMEKAHLLFRSLQDICSPSGREWVKFSPKLTCYLMNKRLITISAFALAAIFLCFAVANWALFRPQRVTSAFVGHLSNERYEEASLMLSAPSSIEMDSEGGLTLIDRAGNQTTVQEARLPFLAGGGKLEGPGDFSMTALQGAENGRVTDPVVIYLDLDGGKVQIEKVDTL